MDGITGVIRSISFFQIPVSSGSRDFLLKYLGSCGGAGPDLTSGITGKIAKLALVASFVI
jgi:hypothetical protein